jgi:hypothetical protein
LFLSSLSREFQSVVGAALNANYSISSIFEDKKELRLITYAVNLTEQFNYNFERNAHSYSFETPAAPTPKHEEFDATSEEDSHISDDEKDDTSFLDDLDLDKYDVLNSIIYEDSGAVEPMKDIMNWIENLYIQSRGIQLGTFGDSILSSAFKEQSMKWADMTKGYISNITFVIHRFMVTILENICIDVWIREEVWSEIIEDVLKRYRAAMNQAMFHVSVEREKRPYTLNHYFNENLQIARGMRKADDLRGKARRELKQSATNGRVYPSDNLIVDLDSIKTATTTKSNVEHIKEDMHDILCSYYKVSRKRFVDNVYLYAVDHSLLTGPDSPLAVFNQEWVIKLTAEQLERIAGESPTGRARRESLLKKTDDLRIALKILRR